MKLESKKIKRIKADPYLLIPSILISFIGVVTLLSTTIDSNGQFGDVSIVQKQVIFLLIGFIIYFLISLFDASLFKYTQIIIPIYILTLILLICVYLFGPVINNVQRWLVIGGVQLQPSEIAKVTVILTTACIFSFKGKYNQWILFLISFLAVLPIFLLVYFEPAGSMSLLILLIWFLVAFTGLSDQLRNSIALFIAALVAISIFLVSFSGNWLYILIGAVGAIIAIFAFYFRDSWRIIVSVSFCVGVLLGLVSMFFYNDVLKDYQKKRIEAFLNPTQNTQDISFNVNQARIAIGSGQILGKGFGNGTQSKRDFLPEHQTDFIFASFAEEFGLVGSLFLLTLYGIIIIRILMIAISSGDTFSSMILVGIAMKILFEVFINIGTNLGVIPATGIPLPLMSAGGTITIMTLLSLGIVQSIINRKDTYKSVNNIIDNY
jgi:rod shape determining protein RodA